MPHVGRRRGRGQGLAEFALVFPIFILLIFGLFDVGRAVFAYNALTNAAREGARFAIVNQDESLVADRARAIAVGIAIDTTDPDLVGYFKKGPNEDVETNDPCDNSSDEQAISVGCIAVVKPRTSWQALTPVIGVLIGPISMQARSELPIEFVCPDADVPEIATAGACPKQP
jgi:hypothetical protein